MPQLQAVIGMASTAEQVFSGDAQFYIRRTSLRAALRPLIDAGSVMAACAVLAEAVNHHNVNRRLGVFQTFRSQQSAVPSLVVNPGIMQATVSCLALTWCSPGGGCKHDQLLQQQRWLLYNTVYEQQCCQAVR